MQSCQGFQVTFFLFSDICSIDRLSRLGGWEEIGGGGAEK